MVSLRKLALTLTMTILISVTLFLPCVKADVQLSQEFVEPVKNWSFEEIGWKVNSTAYWSTNNGGWQELRTDVTGDGKVTLADMAKVKLVYSGQITDPWWVRRCDVTADCKVTLSDMAKVDLDYSARKVAKRIDGSYSWYTSGGGDYQMWQWLDSDTINTVKGKQVVFAFWFLPESIPSGSESEPLGQATSTSGWFCGRELTCTPPSGKSVILRKVQLDVYVEGGGKGYYKITYQKAGEAETLLVSDQEVTNTVQETRTHDVFVWGNEGQSITVYFYIGRYQGSGLICSRNHYMYYQVPAPARAEIKYYYRIDTIYGDSEVFGDWGYPNETKWHSAFVKASIPSYAYAVKVVIHGNPDFKAWIDLASLGIIETKLVQYEDVPDLKVSLAINLFELKMLDESKGRALLAVSMSADAPYPYLIEFTELKITLIQGINVTMRSVTQSNDADYVTDPAQTEPIENNWVTAAELAISILPRYGRPLLTELLGLTKLQSVELMLVFEAAKILLMSTWRTEANIPFADEPGEYAKARITIFEYPFPGGGPIIHFLNERCIAELMFNSGSSCQVEVTAKAKFWTVDGWEMGTLETSTLVTVSV